MARLTKVQKAEKEEKMKNAIRDWTLPESWVILADATGDRWLTSQELEVLVTQLFGVAPSKIGLGRILTPWTERRPATVGSQIKLAPPIFVYRILRKDGAHYRLASVSIPELVKPWREPRLPMEVRKPKTPPRSKESNLPPIKVGVPMGPPSEVDCAAGPKIPEDLAMQEKGPPLSGPSTQKRAPPRRGRGRAPSLWADRPGPTAESSSY